MLLLRLGCLLGLAAPVCALHSSAQSPLHAKMDSIFAPWNRPDVPGAAVAVLQDSSVTFDRGYGSAQLEYGIPITPSTVFMVASVSKQFTAFAIAMLADRGDISLDDPVRSHIPELQAAADSITIRQLVYHTSGLRDEFGLLSLAGYRMDDQISKESILRLLYRQQSLNFDPGEEYLYSNSGYTLLAEILERVTGQSFREWTTEHIFAPLGMRDTHFRDDHGEIIADLAQSYVTDGDTYRRQAVNYGSVGASGLYTTARDLAIWARNFETMQVGSQRVHELVHEQGVLGSGDTLAYAFGQSVSQYMGKRRVSHSGSHRGYRAHLARFPDERLAVIVLSNLEEFNPSSVAMQVADLFLEPLPLLDYPGTYYSAELASAYRVIRKGGKLSLQHSRHPEVTLTASEPDVFTSDAWYLDTVTFLRKDSRVTGFKASNSRMRDVWFERR